MDIRHLRYFVATVEAGSLSQAARQLHIVQPALSQRMADLEGEMGTQLLVRGARGIAATPAGQELYERAVLIIKQFEAAQAAVRQHAEGIAGTVQIGLLRSAAAVVAPALFGALRQEFPALVAQIRVGYSADLAALLRAGRLDIAMQVRSAGSGSVVRAGGARERVLLSERLCLIGPAIFVPPSGSLQLQGLAGVPLLLSSMQPSHSTLLAVADAAGVALSVVGGIEDAAAVLEICESGQAATILPESTAALDIHGRALKMAVLDEPALRRDIHVLTNPDVPATGAVIAVEAVLRRLLTAMARS